MSQNQVANLTAGIIIIGNEVLSGRTQDLNLLYIAQKLSQHGVKVAQAKIIPDIEAEIIATVREYSTNFDYVFTTGGIGPTHDDITAASIAKAFNVELELNAAALAKIEAHWGQTEGDNHRTIMAHMPAGAKIIDNPISSAPGFIIENVYVMAGIPEVMRSMFDSILSFIKHGTTIQSKTVRALLSESMIAAKLAQAQDNYPSLEIGSYPFWNKGGFGTSVVIRGTDNSIILKAVEEVSGLIKELGGQAMLEVD